MHYDPIAEWNRLVKDKVDAGIPEARAVSQVNKQFPGLREAMLEAYNAANGRHVD